MKEILVSLGKYSLTRLVALGLTVVVAIYLVVVIINMGGYLDDSRRDQIEFDIRQQVYASEELRTLPTDELNRLIDERIATEIRRVGLDRPFIERSFTYTTNAVTLSLGRSEYVVSDTGSRQVRVILLDRLPTTLLLIATAELIMFFLSIFGALFLSRRYGSFLDRATIALAPTSAAPAWFYGLFLIMFFAAILGVLPWGGLTSAPPPRETWAYALDVMRHMTLPVAAIVIGGIFSAIYSWRTFFLIYSSEDYVELARAKGLSSQAVERRYVLRPVLPPILTGFLLMLITMWMGAIILETVFNWPGLGELYYRALQLNDTPVIVGVQVIYGYLLAASVFLLDFMYAVLDPRVRIGGRR